MSDKPLTPDDIKKIQQAFEDVKQVLERLIPVIKMATKAMQDFEKMCVKLKDER